MAYHTNEYQQNPQYPQAQQYPQSQQNTVVVVTQPSAQTMIGPGGYPQNTQAWTTGVCDCFEDCGICALGFLCPWIHDCCLASKMNEYVCGPCCCGGLFTVAMRTKVRHLYGIKGDICGDCCCLYWCPCCTMTQMHRELKNRGYF